MEFLDRLHISIFILLNISITTYILFAKLSFQYNQWKKERKYEKTDVLTTIIISKKFFVPKNKFFHQQDIINLAIYLNKYYLKNLKQIYIAQNYQHKDFEAIKSKNTKEIIEALRRVAIIKDNSHIDYIKRILLHKTSWKLEQEVIACIFCLDFQDKLNFIKNHISPKNLSKHNELLLNAFYSQSFDSKNKDLMLAKEGIQQVLLARLKNQQHQKVQTLLREIENNKRDLPMEIAYNVFHFGDIGSKKIICNILLNSPGQFQEIKRLYMSTKSDELKRYLSFHYVGVYE